MEPIAYLYVLLVVLTQTAFSQFLSLRACSSSSAVVASRLANALDTNAQVACNVFCGNSSNVGTYLYNYFCQASLGLGDGFCLITPYGYIAPTNLLQNQVPTITSNNQFLDVPCNFANTPISSTFPGVLAQLNFSNPGSQAFVVNQQVVASTPTDTTVGYIYVDPVNGTLYRGAVGPNVDTTQTIAFTLSQTGTAVYSNTVLITFQLRSCALQISGPDQVNIYGCCFYDDYSALRFTVTTPNAPQVDRDRPSSLAGGFGIPDPIRTQFGAGDLFAPDILFNNVSLGTANNPLPVGFGFPLSATFDQTNDLFILNCNQQPTSPGATTNYCSNRANEYFFLGCQQLLFSASPAASYTGPLQPGTKNVTVCGVGNSNDGGKFCNQPRTGITVFTPDNPAGTETRFIYSNGISLPAFPLPPGVTGGTLSESYYIANFPGYLPGTGLIDTDSSGGPSADDTPVC